MTDSRGPSLALVGVSSMLGKELKTQLAASGFPGDRVALLDLEELAGLVTDYGEEARVFTETVAEQLLNHDLVCFCGDRDVANQHLELLRDADRVGLDCTGAWATTDGVFLWSPGVSAPPDFSETRSMALPSSAATIVGSSMTALGDLGRDAVVNVFIPASELGEPGMKELMQQSIAVLNLQDLEESIFGRQQAFDLWPATGHTPPTAEELVVEMERLSLPVPALNVTSAAVFHGLAVSIFLPTAAPDEVEAALHEAGITDLDAAGESVDSPARAAGHAGVHVAGLRPDAGSGTWLWLVADNLSTRAKAAVAAIHAILGPLPDGPAPTV